jgi:enoyl-CoA hydratase/carnithine racemase
MESSLKRLSMIKNQVRPNKVSDDEPKAQVHLEIKEDIRTAIITWDSPHTLNALHPDTLVPMNEYLTQLETDQRVSCVILTGVGPTFCAGANIKEFGGQYTGGVNFNDTLITNMMRVLSNYKKPIIAAINGYCFGGGLEVALMCDIMIASDEASFGLPEIRLGLIPGAGGTQALIRNVGKSKAMEMILTGKPITAQDAYEHHLVAKVIPHDSLMEAALKTAKAIGKLSLCAVSTAKKCVNHANESTLTSGIDYERGMFNALFGTQDALEGVSAFIEKRKPTWKHC